MPAFTRCRGKTACLEDAAGCRACGRSLEEIAQTRALIEQAARFILDREYDNADEFAAYLAEKIMKRVQHARSTRP